MSRLRQAFYTYWYVSRWYHPARMLVIIGFGLFLIGGGIYALTRPYLSDKLEHLDFSEAMALIEKSSPRYITFKAELDFSKKIYWTGWFPFWGNCPPDQTYQLPSLDLSEGELRKLLGCTVVVKGVTPGVIHRMGRDVVMDGKVQWKEHKAFVQIGGIKGRIWVESDAFKEKEGDPNGKWVSEREWLRKTEFTGILSTNEQAMKGLPEGFPRKISSGSLLPKPDTFVIDDSSDTFYDKKSLEHFSAHYWVPVKGGGNSIFVWVRSGFENDFDGSITGVLQPLGNSDPKTRSKKYNDFSVVIGEALPARFGLIKYRTTAEYNDGEHVVGWPFMLAGSFAVGIGIFGLIVYIMAPRLIFDSWKRAIESVREQWRK